jgi:hypothetical protein
MSDILKHKARILGESIFKHRPWPAREADFDVRPGNSPLDKFYQIIMIPIKFVKAVNEEAQFERVSGSLNQKIKSLEKLR